MEVPLVLLGAYLVVLPMLGVWWLNKKIAAMNLDWKDRAATRERVLRTIQPDAPRMVDPTLPAHLYAPHQRWEDLRPQ